MAMRFEAHPATAKRWPDLVRLFGERGACAGCWCMWWRLRRSEWQKGQGAGNRRRLQRLVASGAEPGIIGYLDGEPVAWCAVAPRSDYPVLGNSRVLRPLDDKPVWSIPCMFIARPHRRQGLSAKMIAAAAKHAARHGARLVEGYPTEAKKGKIPDVFAFTGLPSAFAAAGFHEVARRSPTRPIMRKPVR
jgi:GNAT superfamily N-acetyltransferase